MKLIIKLLAFMLAVILSIDSTKDGRKTTGTYWAIVATYWAVNIIGG